MHPTEKSILKFTRRPRSHRPPGPHSRCGPPRVRTPIRSATVVSGGGSRLNYRRKAERIVSMPRRHVSFAYALPALLICVAPAARADEAAILAEIKAFFKTSDVTRRAEIVRRIESDPTYDRAKVADWLHRAELFKPFESGRERLRVPVDDGDTLGVTLRIPHRYDHRRPYPLLYVLHGTGGNGDGIIAYVERLLGDDIEEHVVAAPTGYQQVIIHSTAPPSTEHPAVLRAVKQTLHVNSDRVYALGFSRGGHAAWTLAVLHPDQFAGIMPVAGTLILQDYGQLYETFLPNIANTRVFCCWGENDAMSADYVTPSEDGGIAGLNLELCKVAARLLLPVSWYEVPDQGHTGIDPPRADVDQLLTATRAPYPRSVRHVFRLPYQGRTYWIEAHAWRGSWWDDQPLKLWFRPGENPDDLDVQREAAARAVRGRLGELRGEINGQEIKVYRKKISELTVWIGDGMLDWNQPVVLDVNGRKAFEGKLKPDLFVCLTQAARTYDFDRLRWAGLRFKSGSRTKVVTGDTPFPAPPITPE
jgi:predicted esterase